MLGNRGTIEGSPSAKRSLNEACRLNGLTASLPLGRRSDLSAQRSQPHNNFPHHSTVLFKTIDLKRKLHLITSLFFAISNLILAQNLIPNPSFEDVNVCFKYHEECSPKAWRNTVLKNFAYREYLGDGKRRRLPGKTPPTIIPPDGTRFVAVRIFNKIRKNDRTFIQTPLLCKLVEGKEYEISFQLYSTTYMIDELGIALVDTMKIFKKNSAVFDIKPQVKIHFDKKIKRNKWHTFSTTFIAEGNEIGFILGNFNTDDQTKLSTIVKGKEKHLPKGAHYVLDNFSLKPVNVDSSEICNLEENKKFIYADSIRHIIYEKVRTVALIPSAEIVSNPTTIVETPSPVQDEEITPEPLIIGNQEINLQEDFVFTNITFENNKAILQSSAFRSLEAIAQFLIENPGYQLQITGHTDNVGADNFNQTLSVQRARAVADFLIRNKVPANRLLTNGRGELEPIETNTTAIGREQNRRVAFQLIK